MKKILIISHWYYPRNNPRSFRARALTDELVSKGFQCDVYVGESNRFISGTELESYYKTEYNDNSRTGTEASLRGVKRVIQKIMRAVIGEKFFLTNVTRALRTIKERYDVIISIGNPFYSHLIAVLVKRKNQETIVIADCGDPFYIKRNHLFTVKLLQKYIFKRINYLSIPIAKAIEYYKDYVSLDIINVIPQGFTTKGIILKDYKKDNVVKFAYAGAFYEDIRNPELLLKFLSSININFEFHVFTADNNTVYKNVLLKYKAIMGEKLQLRPYLKREECIYELSGFDFLVNIENTTPVQSPSKLIDYTISNRPILTVIPNIIEKEKILRFLNGDYSEATIVNINDYKIENVVNKFIALMG